MYIMIFDMGNRFRLRSRKQSDDSVTTSVTVEFSVAVESGRGAAELLVRQLPEDVLVGERRKVVVPAVQTFESGDFAHPDRIRVAAVVLTAFPAVSLPK